MKVLVLGSGAREHALVKAVAADPEVERSSRPRATRHRRDRPVRPRRHPRRRRVAALAASTRSTSSSSVPRPRSSQASPMYAVRPASRCSGPPPRPRASRAASPSPRRSWPLPRADGAGPRVHDDGGGRVGPRRARRTACRQGRRARRGQGLVVTDSREEALGHARACLSKPDGRLVVEEYLDGPRSRSSASATAQRGRALAGPGLQARRRRRRRPQHRRNGRLLTARLGPGGLADEVVRRIAQPTIDEMRRLGTPFVGCSTSVLP